MSNVINLLEYTKNKINENGEKVNKNMELAQNAMKSGKGLFAQKYLDLAKTGTETMSRYARILKQYAKGEQTHQFSVPVNTGEYHKWVKNSSSVDFQEQN